MGWRSPTVNELASLVDLSSPSGLPEGIFNDVMFDSYYVSRSFRHVLTYQSDANIYTVKDGVGFKFDPILGPHTAFLPKGFTWCVRGGGADIVE